MKKRLAALFIASTALAATAQGEQQTSHNLGKPEFIGMVDGYEEGIPQKILGQNIWQSSIQIATSLKRIPIAYTIDDKGRLSHFWVGDAGAGKENLDDTLWLQKQGYDKQRLVDAVKNSLKVCC